MSKASKLGVLGENLAAKYLLSISYKIEELNFRTRDGEIDIIAYDNETLVFVEVKSRRGFQAIPKEAVDENKQAKMSLVALHYIQKKKLWDISARFDVIEVLYQDFFKPKISHLIDAFDLLGGH